MGVMRTLPRVLAALTSVLVASSVTSVASARLAPGPAVTAGTSEVAIATWWMPKGRSGLFVFVAAVRQAGTSAGATTSVSYGKARCASVDGQPRGCRLRSGVAPLEPLAFRTDPIGGNAVVEFSRGGRLHRVTWRGGAWETPGVFRSTGIRVGTDRVFVAAQLGAGAVRPAVASGRLFGQRLGTRSLLVGGIGYGAGAASVVCVGVKPGCIGSARRPRQIT